MIVCAAIPSVPVLTVLEVGDRWVKLSWVTTDDQYAPIRNFTIQMRLGSSAFTAATDPVLSTHRNFTVVG